VIEKRLENKATNEILEEILEIQRMQSRKIDEDF
jgi:hypothetical protein